MKPTKEQTTEAILELQAMVKPGTKINCILRHVSTSGMTRHISLLVGDQNITFLAAQALGENYCNEWRGNRTIKITGCGMDMGFALVYNLGQKLFPEGFKPSDAGRTCGRNGNNANAIDADGGYALQHDWL